MLDDPHVGVITASASLKSSQVVLLPKNRDVYLSPISTLAFVPRLTPLSGLLISQISPTTVFRNHEALLRRCLADA